MTLPNPPTLRQRQAQATRDAIVAAARRLFAQHGYVETSVAEIAEEAGVAVQTVYKSMRSKTAILMALLDVIDEEAEVPALQAGIASATDAAELVHAGVTLTRQMNERCGDIIRALAGAAHADAEAEAALAEGERRHRAGTGGLAHRLEELGTLAVSAEDAAVQISLLTSRHAYDELVIDRGWSFDEAAIWIERTLTERLLPARSVGRYRDSGSVKKWVFVLRGRS
jgi:AcrR family transcriptional regulator